MGWRYNPYARLVDGHVQVGKDIDTEPFLQFNTDGKIYVKLGTNKSIVLQEGGASFGYIYEDTSGNFTLESASNRDILLSPHGTGLVKFGTEIVNAGNARGKLIPFKTTAGDTVHIKTFDTV